VQRLTVASLGGGPDAAAKGLNSFLGDAAAERTQTATKQVLRLCIPAGLTSVGLSGLVKRVWFAPDAPPVEVRATVTVDVELPVPVVLSSGC
jgi:hypothetical protein